MIYLFLIKPSTKVNNFLGVYDCTIVIFKVVNLNFFKCNVFLVFNHEFDTITIMFNTIKVKICYQFMYFGKI